MVDQKPGACAHCVAGAGRHAPGDLAHPLGLAPVLHEETAGPPPRCVPGPRRRPPAARGLRAHRRVAGDPVARQPQAGGLRNAARGSMPAPTTSGRRSARARRRAPRRARPRCARRRGRARARRRPPAASRRSARRPRRRERSAAAPPPRRRPCSGAQQSQRGRDLAAHEARCPRRSRCRAACARRRSLSGGSRSGARRGRRRRAPAAAPGARRWPARGVTARLAADEQPPRPRVDARARRAHPESRSPARRTSRRLQRQLVGASSPRR